MLTILLIRAGGYFFTRLFGNKSVTFIIMKCTSAMDMVCPTAWDRVKQNSHCRTHIAILDILAILYYTILYYTSYTSYTSYTI